ncbi:uncharacterized protein LOC128081562 [Tympanuchus pallidicinctus]|uniref:uncharacterized protein LOC128081562 n=1 Tax=Tympanuchus pallidicinctus TaxID=109042 RepID=UPI002286E443|nr:uncharacterized protein LOC128081562 [Tympanuchus pallidicinctus]
MDVPSNWTCPVCGQAREDVTHVTPCQHQLCYGCAIWWAQKKPTCAVCGHKIITIRYSMRADDDYLECPIPQPTGHSDDGLQDEQGPAESVPAEPVPAEPELIPPEHNFPAEVWAAFFCQHQEDLAPLLFWLQEEIRAMSGGEWWEVQVGLWATVNLLCEHGLDQAALVQELQVITHGDIVPFVQDLISIAAALYGPLIRRQLDQQDGRAARGREDGPAASPNICTSPQHPPASGTEELLSGSTGGPGLPGTATAAEEPQEEPGQAAAAGPSIRSRDRSCGGPRRAPKRKACSSPQDSPPPRKRRPRRRR